MFPYFRLFERHVCVVNEAEVPMVAFLFFNKV